MAIKNDTLINEAFEITVHGAILALLVITVYGRMSVQSLIILCCYLAIFVIWKLVWPPPIITRYFVWQLFSMIMAAIFSWWLIYTAENTRVGWYRFNVLQQRVKTFVHKSPAYVILADCDGFITATSENIELLTGYQSLELVGKHTTILMRDIPAIKHSIAYDKAIKLLRRNDVPNAGWMLQGSITVGVKHKDGHIVPVKLLTGGIRWSTDIQFKGDIDIFAVFIPVSEGKAKDEIRTGGNTTLQKENVIRSAPSAPTVSPLAPFSSGAPRLPSDDGPVYKP